jgi:hypothetical protein
LNQCGWFTLGKIKMIESFKSRLLIIQLKADTLFDDKLAVERDLDYGELYEEYYLNLSKEMIGIKSEMFWIFMELQHLISDMISFNNKFESAKSDPQIKELWETIETAMSIMK